MGRCLVLILTTFATLFLQNKVTAQNDPTNVVCTVLGSASIQLTWTRPSNTAVNGYHISVERVDGIINDTSVPTIVLSSYTYVSYTFHGLANYAQYNLSIHSYIGLTNYTDVFTSCRTDEDAPNGAPLNFNCTAISVSEITCTWDALAQSYWNGVLQGYRLQWLGENVSEIFAANVSTTVFEYTVNSLATNTRYIFLLCGFNTVNYGTVYSTDVETTLGAIIKPVENVTRYYCYEAVPGMIEFSWDEMPCTVYTGTIMGLMFMTLILSLVMCCQCCNKDGPGGVEINFMNGPSRGDSGGSRGSFDDDNSSTETDAGNVIEQDLSDSEHQDGKDSEIRQSATKDTPSNFDDLENNESQGAELSDSDYSSDVDDETNKSQKMGIKRSIKLHNIAKSKIVSTSVERQDCSISLDKKESVGNDDTRSDFENWDPNNAGASGVSETAIPGKSGGLAVVSTDLNALIGTKIVKTAVEAGHRTISSNNQVVDRSVSASSILVDTKAHAFDSIWSPDIPESKSQARQPRQNGVFRSKSLASRNDMPLTVKEKSKQAKYAGKNISESESEVAKMLEARTNSDARDTSDKVEKINLDDLHKTPAYKSDSYNKQFLSTSSTPAWLSQRQCDEIRKATNKTPIQEVNIRQSTIIDIEPILGTDRLGKKFPFLNLDNDEQEVKKNAPSTSFRTNAWSRSGKTTKIPKAFRNLLQKSTGNDVAVTITGDSKSDNTSYSNNS